MKSNARGAHSEKALEEFLNNTDNVKLIVGAPQNRIKKKFKVEKIKALKIYELMKVQETYELFEQSQYLNYKLEK